MLIHIPEIGEDITRNFPFFYNDLEGLTVGVLLELEDFW